VTKLNAAGTARLASTYVGGNDDDEGFALALDSSGRPYLTGLTYSTNFPTQNALMSSGGAGFLTVLNTDGTLTYSSHISAIGRAIALDANANAYIGGYVVNTPISTTTGAYQTSYAGGIYDGFVLKINPAVSGPAGLVYGTFLGGDQQDNLTGLAVDTSGNAYLTGDTASGTFPTTPGAYSRTWAGPGSVFVTKLNAAGSALVYSTFVGVAGTTGLGYSIAVDGAGSAYVSGTTLSAGFPTVNAPQPQYGGGTNDAFVCKLNATGSGLLYSTYLGGTGDDQALGIAVDRLGNAYVSGATTSPNLPTSPTALQGSNAGGYDAFVTAVAASGTALLSSSYLGGVGDDWGYGIAVSGGGAAYVAGSSAAGQAAGDFPTTGLQSANQGGATDAFVTRLPTAPQPGLTWDTRLTALPRLESGAAASFGRDGTLYVVGGTDGVSTDYQATDLYHPASNTWTVGATYPLAVEGAAAVTLPDGRIVVLGGGSGCHFQQTSCTIYANVNAYDPHTGLWTPLAALNTPRYNATAVVRNGQIYAIGGWNGSQPLAGVEVYDPQANTWTNGPSLPQAVEGLAAAVEGSGTIDVVGGFNGISGAGCVDYNSLYRFTGSGWSAGPAMPSARHSLMAGIGPDGQLYAIGGYSGAEGCNTQAGFRATVEAYNPGSGRWTTAQPLPQGTCCAAMAVAPSGQFYLLGGNARLGQSAQVTIGALSTASGGPLPWHPHQRVRVSDHLSVEIDLADGHVDVTAHDLSLPGRGPDLSLSRTWDSVRAQESPLTTTAAGAGWSTDLTPSMGGVLTDTVTYTDSSGTAWFFPYTGLITDTAPYTAYQVPGGQPWQLTAAPTGTTGYTLTNILTGEVQRFNAQGQYLSDQDAYSNTNTLTYTAGLPTGLGNSGGRALAFTYQNGLLADAQSPLWQSGGASAAGSQHVTYGYTNTNQLQTVTWGAGTTNALTATFGYQGQQLVTITTPYTQSPHTWTLAYDPFGRLSSLTSPISGTPGQAGYTPAYTTTVLYTPGMTQTQLIAGYGTSAALTTTYTLDAQGQATQVQDGLGHGTTTSYDADHDVLAGTDANGNQTTNLYQYVGPTGSTGLLTQTVQPPIQAYSPLNGTLDSPTTRHLYNATNDLIETDLPEGGRELFGYDTHHGVITTTQTTALSTTWRGSVNQMDAFGELTGVVDGRGVSVSSSGVATLAANAGSYTRHLSYTGSGDVASASTAPITTTLNGVTKASTPVTTTYGYDGDGNQTSVTSANGKTTTSGYDHLGRPVTTTLPTVTLYTGANVAPVQTTGYDGEGNAVRRVDGTGAVTLSSYDPLGRAVSETNAVGATTLITYSATQQVAQQDALGNVTAYSYDAAGRLTQTVNPLGTTMQLGHDALGNTTVMTTGDGTTATQVDTRHYDALNQVVTDTLSGPGTPAHTTQTSYDHDGNVVQVQQPAGDVTYASHDLADQQTALEIDPAPVNAATGATQETASYDTAGNRNARVDFDTRDHATTFDADNRAAQSTDSLANQAGSTTITTTAGFDPDGNVLSQSMQTAGQTHTYTATFNAADWRTSTSDDGLLTAYGYDGAGQMRTRSILNGVTPITTTLNAAGLVTATSEALGGTPHSSTFAYNANDLPVSATLNSGPTQAQETVQYDPNSRLTRLQATGPATAPAPLASTYSYGYTALGWTTGLTSTLNGVTTTQAITHDALGRVSGVQSGSTTQSFGYDGNGNLTQAVTNGSTTTYSYNNGVAPNEVQTVSTAGQPTTSYTYDQNGDTTSITNTSTISTGLSYDRQARPVGVTLKDGTSVSLSYNSAGQRASYVVSKPGQPTLSERFQYRGQELGQAVVVTGTTSFTDTYVYNPGGLPLELLRQQNGTTSRYWYVLDGRGNVVALTDTSGNVVDRYAYDVWGQPTSVSENVPQRLRYAGYWYDQELGWYGVGVRLYDPSLKRWLQPDPSQQDGVRTYAYVGDDPVDETDPTGLQGGAGVAIGAGAGALCVGTIPVPILGEIDCAAAIAILGVAAVASLLAAQQTHVSPPQTLPRVIPRTRDNQRPNWVVRGGEAEPQDLIVGYREHRGVPGLFGFSVQYAPGTGLSVDQLAEAGHFFNRQISYATDQQLMAAVAPTGYEIALIESLGGGYRATLTVIELSTGQMMHELPPSVADAISAAFQRKVNPYRVTR
jgi:RHS repeat-associated protein